MWFGMGMELGYCDWDGNGNGDCGPGALKVSDLSTMEKRLTWECIG